MPFTFVTHTDVSDADVLAAAPKLIDAALANGVAPDELQSIPITRSQFVPTQEVFLMNVTINLLEPGALEMRDGEYLH